MKAVSSETCWRSIRRSEVESVIKYARKECRYHKVGSWLFIALIVVIFAMIAVFSSIYNSWNVLRFIVFMLAFLLVISLPVYLIVQEEHKIKMLIDGKVRCMTVTVLHKRIGARGLSKGGVLYLVGINRPDASNIPSQKQREYDVSKATYNATRVKGKGLLIRFDDGSEEKSAFRYRFLPLVD